MQTPRALVIASAMIAAAIIGKDWLGHSHYQVAANIDGVYRVDTRTGETCLLLPTVARPNWLNLSGDEKNNQLIRFACVTGRPGTWKHDK